MTVVSVRPGDVPVPPWPMGQMAREVYQSFGPLTFPDPDHGWALAKLIDAWCTVGGWVYEACYPAPGEVSWQRLLDPDRCPWWALRWCGQLYGVRLLPALDPWVRPDPATEVAWRQEVRERPRWRRGSVGAIRAAAQQFQVGLRRVQIRERYDGVSADAPYHLAVRVRASDLAPGVDHADVVRAVLAAIPAGLVAAVAITDDATYDDVREQHENYAAVNASVDDYNDMRGS